MRRKIEIAIDELVFDINGFKISNSDNNSTILDMEAKCIPIHDSLKMNGVKNSEVVGMTCEKAICEIYNIDNNINDNRVDSKLLCKMKERLLVLKKYIKPTTHTGSKNGSDDFITEDGKTLSVKTNMSTDKVCPQKIGQCSKNKFIEHFSKVFQSEFLSSSRSVKEYILKNTKIVILEYLKYIFCCDKLLYISFTKKKDAIIINEINVIDQSCRQTLHNKILESSVSFTKTSVRAWRESNTVRLNDRSIGEFQIHKN